MQWRCICSDYDRKLGKKKEKTFANSGTICSLFQENRILRSRYRKILFFQEWRKRRISSEGLAEMRIAKFIFNGKTSWNPFSFSVLSPNFSEYLFCEDARI
ncbi:hypothetical protein DLM78_09450 [Leptospira stimsonii]|uniref:Uncharacterized protein n=1 Tax=Leptospira stimsonii TaxID=2202203 RepID=A0A8B6RYF0_9LEPT|nr:hypothetical protein DLM78_09450 [Leptospira stimsonii]